MIIFSIRIAAKQRGCLVAAIVCALAAGCGGDAGPAALPGPAAVGRPADDMVLLALDCYDPMYKVDAEGRVTHLRLTGRDLPPPVLAEVGKLTELRALDVAFATVTDEGLRQLKDLQKLRSFGLGHTQVTDQGLPHLEKLQGLQYLWLTRNSFSPEAVDKLKSARPDVNVYLH